VELDLRGDEVGEDFGAVAKDGCGGFVATAFDAEDEAGLHGLIVGGCGGGWIPERKTKVGLYASDRGAE
jgi:hypothetical protein